MEITEVRIQLIAQTQESDERLEGFANITFENAFVVRDLKIIFGGGRRFVDMPSRKLTDHCDQCNMKNHLRACFCSGCGRKLDPERATRSMNGRAMLHAPMAHPINPECRRIIEHAVITAYHAAVRHRMENALVFFSGDQVQSVVNAEDREGAGGGDERKLG